MSDPFAPLTFSPTQSMCMCMCYSVVVVRAMVFFIQFRSPPKVDGFCCCCVSKSFVRSFI